jgi:hypothetical protein
MHEAVRRHIQSGFGRGEWEQLAPAHPVARLYLAGRNADGDRLLREYTAAHEAGHAVLGLTVGLDVREVVVAHLHEIPQAPGGGTIGYAQYRVGRHAPDPIATVLHDLAGIAGHSVLYGDQWCLDGASWTAPGELAPLRDEGSDDVGGDAWQAREHIKPIILRGERFLGQSTVGGAMVAAVEQAEALLVARRGALLRLAGHLLSYGKADRAVIDQIVALPE